MQQRRKQKLDSKQIEDQLYEANQVVVENFFGPISGVQNNEEAFQLNGMYDQDGFINQNEEQMLGRSPIAMNGHGIEQQDQAQTF